jgi:exonuclease VII large subunit
MFFFIPMKTRFFFFLFSFLFFSLPSVAFAEENVSSERVLPSQVLETIVPSSPSVDARFEKQLERAKKRLETQFKSFERRLVKSGMTEEEAATFIDAILKDVIAKATEDGTAKGLADAVRDARKKIIVKIQEFRKEKIEEQQAERKDRLDQMQSDRQSRLEERQGKVKEKLERRMTDEQKVNLEERQTRGGGRSSECHKTMHLSP